MTPSGVAWYQWGIPIRVCFTTWQSLWYAEDQLAPGCCVGGRSPGRLLVLFSLKPRGCASLDVAWKSCMATVLRVESILVCSEGGTALLIQEGNPGWPAHMLLSSFSLWLLIQCWINKGKNGKKKVKVRLLNVISAQLSEEISRECQNLLSYATLEWSFNKKIVNRNFWNERYLKPHLHYPCCASSNHSRISSGLIRSNGVY